MTDVIKVYSTTPLGYEYCNTCPGSPMLCGCEPYHCCATTDTVCCSDPSGGAFCCPFDKCYMG